MKKPFKFMLALIIAVASSSALACGDSLYRVGKGVAYRTYSAPLPGNLLLLSDSAGAQDLASALASSGHKVQLVKSVDELMSALSEGDYDVVIAPFSDRAPIESSSAVAFLPMAVAGEEEKLAKQAYNQVMVPKKHELKHYLKAIHRELKKRA